MEKQFSTQWKNFFQTVENLDIRLFSGVLGCSLGAVERSMSAPHVSRSGRPAERPRKRCPTKAGSALSRSRLGCGVGRGPFYRSRGRGFLARSDETGAVRASEDLLLGAVKKS